MNLRVVQIWRLFIRDINIRMTVRYTTSLFVAHTIRQNMDRCQVNINGVKRERSNTGMGPFLCHKNHVLDVDGMNHIVIDIRLILRLDTQKRM